MAIRVMRALSILGITSGLIFSSIMLVWAVQGVTIFPGQSTGINYSSTENGTLLVVQPGNLTFLQVSGTAGGFGNIHWTGFYGNISGNLTLQDANGAVFYEWVGLGTPAGEVFASNSSVVDWDTINCTNSSQIDAINTYLNLSLSAKDTVNETYSSNSHPAFTVAANSIPADTCNSTNAYSNGVPDPGLFYQVLLSDADNTPVFTTLINSSSTDYSGAPVDFELLAGVPGGSTTAALYFFMELG